MGWVTRDGQMGWSSEMVTWDGQMGLSHGMSHKGWSYGTFAWDGSHGMVTWDSHISFETWVTIRGKHFLQNWGIYNVSKVVCT